MEENIFESQAEVQAQFRQTIIKICINIKNQYFSFYQLNQFINYKMFLDNSALPNNAQQLSKNESIDDYIAKNSICYKFVLDKINLLKCKIEKYSATIPAQVAQVCDIISELLSSIKETSNKLGKLYNDNIDSSNLSDKIVDICYKQTHIEEVQKALYEYLKILPIHASDLGTIKGGFETFKAHEIILNMPNIQQFDRSFIKFSSIDLCILHSRNSFYKKTIEKMIQQEQIQYIFENIFNLFDKILALNLEIVQVYNQETSSPKPEENNLSQSTYENDSSMLGCNEDDSSILGYNDGFTL